MIITDDTIPGGTEPTSDPNNPPTPGEGESDPAAPEAQNGQGQAQPEERRPRRRGFAAMDRDRV